MGYKSATIARESRESTGLIGQRNFSAGIWNDPPATQVPKNGLSDGENIVYDDIGNVIGRPGVAYISNALVGVPVSNAFIPKAANGRSYMIQKIATGIYYSEGTTAQFGDNTVVNDLADGSPAMTSGEYSQIVVHGDKAYLFDTTGIYEIFCSDTDNHTISFIKLNSPVPDDKGTATYTNTQSGTAYYRDYLFTFVRIVDGVVTHESGAHQASGDSVGQGLQVGTQDLVGSEIDPGLYATVNHTSLNDKTMTGIGKHFTHIRMYSTLSYTLNSTTNQVTNGVDRNVFGYVNDTAIAASGGTTASDVTTDDVLRARIAKGNVCQSRFLQAMPSGPIGTIAKEFLMVGTLTSPKKYYCSLYSPNNTLVGYYYERQWVSTKRNSSCLAASGTKALFFAEDATEGINVSGYDFFEDVYGQRIPRLWMVGDISTTIGVPRNNFGTLTKGDGEEFIAITNEGCQVFDGYGWGPDISRNKFHEQIVDMPAGATAVFGNGKYYLWYRSSIGQSDYNDLCLVVDFDKSELPWSKFTGAATTGGGVAFPFPGLYSGAIAIKYLGRTLTCCFRRHYGTSYTDRRMYWIDTFDSTSNAILSEETMDNYYEDDDAATKDIACNWTPRHWTSVLETNELTFRHLFPLWDYAPGQSAFLADFAVDVTVIENETEKETIENIKTDTAEIADVTPSWMRNTNRLGLKFSTNKTRFLFRGYDMDVDDVVPIKDDAAEPEHVDNQTELAGFEACAASYNLSSTTADGDFYTAGSVEERYNNSTLDFFRTGTQAKFAMVTGPDGVSESAIGMTRVSDSDACGFRKSFSTALTKTAFSISLWAKTDSASYQSVLKYAASTALTDTLKLDVKSDTLRIIDDAGAYATYSADFTSWVHIFITQTGGTWTVYINGTETSAGSTSGTLALPATISVVDLGDNQDSGNVLSWFEWRHYASVLGTDDILYHYNDVVSNAGDSSLDMR